MNFKKCILLAVIFILLANQLSTAARPRRRTRASRQKAYIKVGQPKAAMRSRQYSPERLITNAQYRRAYALANGEKPKRSLGAYLTRQEKRGLQRLVESQIKINPRWGTVDFQESIDQRRHKQLKVLLGKRYADRWLAQRKEQLKELRKTQKEKKKAGLAF